MHNNHKRSQILAVLAGLSVAGTLLVGCTGDVTSTVNTITTTEETPEVIQPTTSVLAFAPTQCNDTPWELAGYRAETDEQIEEQVTSFLSDQLDITAQSVSYLAGDPEKRYCAACGCPTGKTIEVVVSTNDAQPLLDIGFVQQAAVLENSDIAEVPVVESSDVLSEVADEVYASESGEAGQDSTPELNDEQQALVDEVVAIEEETQDEANEQDQLLADSAATLQQQLSDYYKSNGSYPAALSEIDTANIDLTHFSYTPIGASPATYYDLSVLYTTGREVLNP